MAAKILIIEDDAAILSNWLELLGLSGYSVIGVKDGITAYQQIESNKFDLVLSDVKVPGLDGFSLKKKLNAQNNRTPVIFISAFPIMGRDVMLRGLAAIRFLPKPIAGKELIEAIESALHFAQYVRIRPEYLKPIAKLDLYIEGKKLEPSVMLSKSYSLGRHPESDIYIPNPDVSREHCIFQRIYDKDNPGKSLYSVVDYSRNGFTVNGKKVTGHHDLRHGDLIKISSCQIVYYHLQRPEDAQNPFVTIPGAE